MAYANLESAPIHSARTLVMKTADIDGHALHQQCDAFAGGFIAAGGKLVEEFLMAVNRLGWPCGAKVVVEQLFLNQVDSLQNCADLCFAGGS